MTSCKVLKANDQRLTTNNSSKNKPRSPAAEGRWLECCSLRLHDLGRDKEDQLLRGGGDAAPLEQIAKNRNVTQ